MAILHQKVDSLQPSPLSSHVKTQLDQALTILAVNKQGWADLPNADRVAMLDQIKVGMRRVEDRWVAAGMRAKGSQPATMAEGEEWFTLSIIYRYIRFLRKTLVDIDRHGQPKLPGRLCWKTAGQWTVDLLPQTLHDRLALLGVRAEAHVRDSLQGDAPPMAAFYRQEKPVGKVALVLAAGNVSSLPPNDALHKLFVEGQVVLLKMNPVNAYLGPLLAEAFAALIERGFLQIVDGGAEVGAYLSQHPHVDELHITGSARTYEAIVFGSGAEGQERKKNKAPILDKPFSAELGNVSPVIVVPGPWSQRDIRKQAAKYATGLVANAGFNCVTPRVFIQMEGWPHRQKLNEEIAAFLANSQRRQAYYPGSTKQQADFVAKHPEALQLGSPKEGELPWTYIPEVDSADSDDICFREEAFLGLFAETAIPAKDTIDFITKAVEFANRNLWGTLCASIVVHPKSLADPMVKAAVDQAIADLQYGSVVVNHWGALAYYTAVTPWGGYPGHDKYDIQSGEGKVHNPLMFDDAQKSVLYAPFISFPDPYVATAKNNYRYFRQDTRYQYRPSTLNLIKLLWAALLS
jgi:acyl-CoA reductase-like NAD-dependent aldehyde dehydrogenase